MPPSPPNNNGQNRHIIVDRPVRTCEPCRRRKKPCNGVRPCSHCSESQIECVYSVVSDLPRSVFTTSSARRLSSGSACETCRRRKTKCDGGSPCGFCSSAGIECVNNSERRKRAMGIPNMAPQPNMPAPQDSDAIDRIEDRLRRIEKLMIAFSPNPNSPLSTAAAVSVPVRSSLGSSPPSSSGRIIRQHRHSVQGISVAKEQAELRTAYALKKKRGGLSPPSSPFCETSVTASNISAAASRYATPPNSGSKARCSPSNHPSPSPPPPSLSPIMHQNSIALNTQPLTSSMFNLTLSPSSSTSSTSNTSSMLIPALSGPHPSMSSHAVPRPLSAAATGGPHDDRQSLESSSRTATNWSLTENEWNISASSIPSLMDQLSKRTFGNTPPFTFPPYPLTPPHTYPRQQAPSSVE